MLINNTEALKSWLVVVLAPLCDADSSALARYVLALLKKDKPENDLKRVMIEQLDVFLGEETTPFVDRLFAAISTEEYLVMPPTISSTPTIMPPAVKLEEFGLDDNTSSDMPSNSISLPVNNNKLQEASKITDKSDLKYLTSDMPVKNNSAYVEHSKLSIADEQKTKELNHHHQHHHHHKSTNDAASMNNHHCKIGNSSSTESSSITANNTTTNTTSNSTATNTSNPRNVTPTRGVVGAADKENQPRESRRRRASMHSRSRSRSADRFSRRSRSPRDRRGGQRQFRNKSPSSSSHERRRGGFNTCDRRRAPADSNRKSGVTTNRSNPHSSLSPSPERRQQGNVGSANSVNKTSAIENNTNSPKSNREHGENGNSKIGGCVGEKRQRCRDFDEKGYCVRGETCPWDHGVNPVVFEGLNNPALISMSLREYNPDAPDLWSRATPTSGVPGSGVVGGTRPTGINPFTGAARVPSGNVSGAGMPSTIVYPAHVAVGAGVGMDKSSATQDYVRVGGGPTQPVGYRGGAPNLMQFPFNALTTPMQQRELIPIPVVDADGGVGTAGPNALSADNIGGPLNQQLPGGKRRYDNENDQSTLGGMQDAGPTKRKIPLNSRLGPRMPSNNMQNNCSLELRKIPRGLNTIAHLNNHFAKFGKIINIQISYEGDPEAAIVTFSTHAEANVAYRSTEAVLNNRFIKVFWHSNVDANSSSGSAGGGVDNNLNAMGVGMNGARKSNHHYHLNNMITQTSTTTSSTTSTVNSNDTTNKTLSVGAAAVAGGTGNNENNNAAVNNETINSNTTLAATHLPTMSLRLKNNVPTRSNSVGGATGAGIRKKQEEQVKAVVQLANGLRKRKQELLQSYVKQMKSALEIVERCEPQDGQRAQTLETIKVLQATIDKLRKEIAAEQEQVQAQITHQQQQHSNTNLISSGTTSAGSTLPVVKKTKEQQKKELLDIELELFAQQQEGNDTTAIQKRLEELQRSLGIGNAPPANPAGGQPPVAGPKLGAVASATHFGNLNQRGAINQSPRALRGAVFPEGPTRVDRRPKTIVITGFTADEADFVLGHFKHFGEILKHDVDREIPQLILSYASRMSAEQAVMRGKMYKSKRLQISWAPVITNMTTSNTVATTNEAQNVANKQIVKKLENDVLQNAAQKLFGNKEQEHKQSVEGNSQSDAEKLLSAKGKPPLDIKLSEKMNSEDALLPELRLEDEEEEDECEDRSWRR